MYKFNHIIHIIKVHDLKINARCKIIENNKILEDLNV